MAEKLDLDALEESLKGVGNICLPVHATQLLGLIARIRELESASQPGGREVKQKPVAWMHTMDNTEGIKGNKPWVVITTSKRNPFGKPGIDYSACYPVTSEPLYRAATSAGNGGAEGCDADQA